VRRFAWAGAVCAACQAPADLRPPPVVASVLRNPGFEAEVVAGARCAPGWDCTMHSNPEAFRFFQAEGMAGGRGFCIERVADEPWALLTQALQGSRLEGIRGKRMRLSLAVRVEGAGGAGAGPWMLVQGAPPLHASRLASGTSEWQRLSIELTVPPHASVVEVGATLEGPGRACFDEARLEPAQAS